MMRLICVTLAASALINCSQANVPETPDGHPTVKAYSNAYNAKDIDTLKSLMHPDIEWVSVTGSEIQVHISGKDALSKKMQDWFKNPKLPTGSLKGWSLNGDYVAVTETAHWTTDAGEAKSQSALTVYQFQNGLIRRVYYYAAT